MDRCSDHRQAGCYASARLGRAHFRPLTSDLCGLGTDGGKVTADLRVVPEADRSRALVGAELAQRLCSEVARP